MHLHDNYAEHTYASLKNTLAITHLQWNIYMYSNIDVFQWTF